MPTRRKATTSLIDSGILSACLLQRNDFKQKLGRDASWLCMRQVLDSRVTEVVGWKRSETTKPRHKKHQSRRSADSFSCQPPRAIELEFQLQNNSEEPWFPVIVSLEVHV